MAGDLLLRMQRMTDQNRSTPAYFFLFRMSFILQRLDCGLGY
jgi:hypothetical protein